MVSASPGTCQVRVLWIDVDHHGPQAAGSHVLGQSERDRRAAVAPGHGRHGERIVGTKGTSNCTNSCTGETSWRYAGGQVNAEQQEHNDLIRSIRAGRPLNEGRRIAESTLTAIGVRMACYTGRDFTWKWLLNSSKLDLVPRQLKTGPGIFHPVASGRDALV